MISNTAIKIAFLVPHQGVGGAEVALKNLLKFIDYELFEAHLLTSENQPLTHLSTDCPIIVHHWTFPTVFSTSLEIKGYRIFNPFSTIYLLLRLFFSALKIRQWLKNNNIDVLYTGSTHAHLLGIVACLGIKCNLLWHFQEIISPQLAFGFGRQFLRIIAKHFVHSIVVPSQAIANSLDTLSKIYVIPYGLFIETFENQSNKAFRDELSIDDGTILIGIVGRLTPWKGHKLFLTAAAQIIEQGYSCHFVVVGSSMFKQHDYRPKLEAFAQKLGISGKVSFIGMRDDVPNVISGCDMIIVPSIRPEPFGIVAIESMACKTPVIGSNAGGLAEIIIHQQTGLLFHSNDSADLASAMKTLIESLSLREVYGEAGYERVVKCYQIQQYGEKVSRVLELTTTK